MLLSKYWVRRRWWDARAGHTAYLMFALTIVNFILISYRFFIEKNPVFQELLSNLWLFVLFFIITYIPISTIIGYWHRKTQLSTETTIKKLEDPLFAKMIKAVLDIQTGKISKEDIEKIRNMLLKIEKIK